MKEFRNVNDKKLAVILYIAVGYLLWRVFWAGYLWVQSRMHSGVQANTVMDLVVGFLFLLFFVPACVALKRLLVRFLEK